jgi:predicted aspartyl protease
MIRGYYLTTRGRRRPFVDATLEFPTLGRRFGVQLLVDTGADRTVLAPLDAARLGVDLAALPEGAPSTGVGGRVPTRAIQARIILGTFSTLLAVTVLGSPPGAGRLHRIPSLLGRDVLSRFALFVEERTSRVLLLTPDEADALPLP